MNSRLFIYPVKSLGGTEISEIKVRNTGFEYDRKWMLVDENRDFVTQRKYPKLCLITAKTNHQSLTLSADNQSISNDISEINTEVEVDIWGEKVIANLCNTQLSEFISDFIGAKLSLVKIKENARTFEHNNLAKNIHFVDAKPILIVNSQSVDFLSKSLSSVINPLQFRPNILTDLGESFSEDNLSCLTIDNIQFDVIKKCSRCIVININPENAISSKEPLKLLSTFRKEGNKVNFGVYAYPISEGIIKNSSKVFYE